MKSKDGPAASNVLIELKVAMQEVNATERFLVSQAGDKAPVVKQAVSRLFSVRLWTQNELLDALFVHYDQIDDELKAELLLKRTRAVRVQDDA